MLALASGFHPPACLLLQRTMSSQSTHVTSQPSTTHLSAVALPAFTDEDDVKLRETLKRCSAATYEAAREFRKTGDVAHVAGLLQGIIERYVEREHRGKLAQADDSLRLIEDLGLDSLTLMEIVVLAEEVLPISINNEDLCRLRTLGDVKRQVVALMHTLGNAPVHPTATSCSTDISHATG